MTEPLGARVRRLRLALGISSQEKLAVKADVSSSTVARLERGEIDSDTDTLTKLAEALGQTLTELLGGESAPEPAYPSLALVLSEFPRITANERSWLMSHRFPDGEDIGDSDYWMAQLLLFRQQVKAIAADKMLHEVSARTAADRQVD